MIVVLLSDVMKSLYFEATGKSSIPISVLRVLLSLTNNSKCNAGVYLLDSSFNVSEISVQFLFQQIYLQQYPPEFS
jgi:hypothetical protein